MKSTSLRPYEFTLGGFYGLFQLFVLPALAVACNTYLNLPGWGLQFGIFALNFLCSLVIFHRFLSHSWDCACETPGQVAGYGALGLLIYYGGTIGMTTLIMLLRPDYANLNNGSVSQLASQGGSLIFLAIALFAPVAEELLYRGVLFQGFYKRSPFLAWCISVLSFALVHVVGYMGQYDLPLFLLAVCQYIPAGISLCLAYRLSGTIITPILMHMMINTLAYFAM